MTTEVILGLCILIPAVLGYVLRVNTAILFMSLCVGEVLVIFVSNNASSYLSPVFPTGNISLASMRIFLLVAPIVVTLLLMFHTVHGRSKQIIDLIPSLATGLLLGLVLVPVLPAGLSLSIQKSNVWHQYYHYQTVIVVFGALCSLVFLLLGRQKSKQPHGSGSKHH